MSSVQNAVRCVSDVSAKVAEPHEPQWFAVHTRAQHEKQAFATLEEKGISTFAPMISQVHRWTDRRKIVNVPLFPCYLFVRIAPSPDINLQVLQTTGVLRFVGFSGGPAPIPEEQIENVKAVLVQNVPFSCCGFLNVGQRVRIRGGALEGVEGILTGCKGNHKLIVSIDLIQKSMAVVVEGYDIEPIG